MSAPKAIDNNRGKFVLPGGHLDEPSTVLEVADNEFRAEIGVGIELFGMEQITWNALDHTDLDDINTKYYAVYVKAKSINPYFTQNTVDIINDNFKKNDGIRWAVLLGDTYKENEHLTDEYYDESIFFFDGTCVPKR